MFEILSNIFDHTLIYATIRSSIPLVFAALAAVITQQADILNIGVEGIMLMGAFAAVTTSFLTGSWLVALIVAMLVGLLFAIIMGIAHLKYKADIFVIGTAINMLALALTRFLLSSILKTSGSFYSDKIVGFPKIHFDILEKNKYLNDILNNYSLLEIIGIIMVFIMSYVLYRTVWGLRLRSVGLFPMAAETAGINVFRMKFQAILCSGLLGGMAGAHLSLGYSKLFAENMTNGRGFMGVAAMFFGAANPVLSAIGCFIFGLSDSIGARLQSYGFSSQFVLMIPYLFTVAVLAVSMFRHIKKEQKAKSSLSSIEYKSFGFLRFILREKNTKLR